MNKIRLRGFFSIVAAVVIAAWPSYFIWRVDYRGGQMAGWMMPFFVAFLTPAVMLFVRGVYSLLTGKVLGLAPVRIRL